MASGLPSLMDPNTVTSEPKKFQRAEGAKEQFRESLGKGIPIEGGKRSVFGFGLSGEQEDALYDYLTTKGAVGPPGYEPDRAALAECWGSPTPPEQPCEKSASAEDGVDVASTESLYEGEGGVDVASTESLYEGEGGVDLGARSTKEEPSSELADRLLIVQKVKECYGEGVKTSLERVMRNAGAGDGELGVLAAAPQDAFLLIKSCNTKNSDQGTAKEEKTSSILREEKTSSILREEKTSSILQEENSIVNPTKPKMVEDRSFQNLWEDECMRYLERVPEFRARLHYEVRVILILPVFHMAGSTVSAFARLYEKKFGRTIDSVGFSTAARLCRSMPHVVQRTLLIDEGKLRLVDTPKNHRIVAGIRSGLRRIVYCVVKSHQGVNIETIEALLERVIGRSIYEILYDHGYQNPSMECLLRDVPDIVYLDEHPEYIKVFLCSRAEDPALTDGLLVQGPSFEECFEGMLKDKNKFKKSRSMCYSESLEEGKLQSLNGSISEQMTKIPEGPRSGPNGMAPEELSDLRVLCAAESSSPYRDASIYTIEDVSPHVRLRFRLLLALHNDGHGIKIEELSTIYEKMFSVPLDILALGFDSIKELIETWKDVVLVKDSVDGWIFPINTPENNRVLNTITSGLRSAVFAILLARYPEGLEPLELVECLEETLCGKLWEILKSNGYIFKNISKTRKALSKSPLDFKLAECSELRLLLQDMEDFVRLGCQEDGALIVKLRDGEFPLLDLLDCEVSQEHINTNSKQCHNSIDTNAMLPNLTTDREDLLLDQAIEARPNVIMAMNNQVLTTTQNKSSTIKDEALDQNIKIEELTALIKKPFNKENLSSLSTLPTTIPNDQVDTSKQVCHPSQKLIHETRMIFGSSEYMENGLTAEEFCTIYRERTGQPLHLDEFKSVESLLKAMPDIVNFEPSSTSDEQMITLQQSHKNMRILSIAKAGLRQVLFWILMKNPNGIWKELLEGWYLDFAGWPLSSTLASHGYDKPRCLPLEPIIEFLQDMSDILSKDENDSSLYIWARAYEDPIIADASLLGTSIESIQYDPTNEKIDNSKWQTSITARATTQLKNKEFTKTYELKATVLLGDTHGIEAH